MAASSRFRRKPDFQLSLRRPGGKGGVEERLHRAVRHGTGQIGDRGADLPEWTQHGLSLIERMPFQTGTRAARGTPSGEVSMAAIPPRASGAVDAVSRNARNSSWASSIS